MDDVVVHSREQDVKRHLENVGIYATPQRRAIAEVLFRRHQHLTADEIYEKVARSAKGVSRATIYNTLNLFTEKGLLREIFVDASRTFYDTNTRPHYHLYNVDTGLLVDIEDPAVNRYFSRELPDGVKLEGIDIVIRVRNSKTGS
ncbi:MAG TPA: transcriptional repressor [Chromatiaceae bacterium]|nr:transcriptional repressor [Chromatiaceae bacterium]